MNRVLDEKAIIYIHLTKNIYSCVNTCILLLYVVIFTETGFFKTKAM